MRTAILSLLVALSPLPATTLEQLSLDEMIQKSSGIVRARVEGSSSAFRGAVIYTHYRLRVLEQWKGASVTTLDLAVPGGVAQGLRQMGEGSPRLSDGEEYVVFLWTGKSGLVQIIGLSQGLFQVKVNAAGEPVLLRPAANELMLDRGGNVVKDEAIEMRLSDLRSRIAKLLAAK